MPYTITQLIIQFSYPLYVFVMVQFLTPSKRKKFYNSYFFNLSIALGFMDILQYSVVWVFVKLPTCSLTYRFYTEHGDAGYVFNVLYFLQYYTILARCFLILSGAVNRFTCLTMPFRHIRLWQKYGKYFLFASFLFPLLTTGNYLFGDVVLYIASESVAIVIRSKLVLTNVQTTTITVEILITAILTLFINMGTIFCMVRRKDIDSNGGNQKQFAKEKKLVFITFWDFVVDVAFTSLRTISFIRTIVGRTDSENTPYILTIWVMDFGNLIRPIFLILMCDPLREAFLNIFSSKKYNKVSNIVFTVK